MAVNLRYPSFSSREAMGKDRSIPKLPLVITLEVGIAENWRNVLKITSGVRVEFEVFL